MWNRSTESWHQSSSDVTVRRSTPSGYSAVDRLWPDGSSYGGIAYSTDPTSPFVGCRFPPRRPHSRPSLCPSLHHVVLSRSWRPTALDQHHHCFSMSLRYYSSNSHSTTRNSSSLASRNLNLHLEDPSLPASSEFRTIIDQFGLAQHVTEPTHKAGGWLDHGLVTATIPFLCDTPSYLIKQVRDWRNLDWTAFGSALLEIPVVADPSIMNDLPVADVFATYQSAMAEVFERLLPTRQARICRCP